MAPAVGVHGSVDGDCRATDAVTAREHAAAAACEHAAFLSTALSARKAAVAAREHAERGVPVFEAVVRKAVAAPGGDLTAASVRRCGERKTPAACMARAAMMDRSGARRGDTDWSSAKSLVASWSSHSERRG
jgi:hypothetical protein